MSKRELGITATLFILALSTTFLAGYVFHAATHPPELQYPILARVVDLIETRGLSPLPEGSSLEYGMINGFIQAYADPYTHFLAPSQQEINTDRLEGVYGGIGSRLGRDDKNNIVLFPFADSPAELAGIKEGDILIEVDEIPISAESNTDDVVALLRGPEGEKVSIIIYRDSTKQTLSFDIKRVNIPLPSVTSHLHPKHPEIGVLEVNLIADSTPEELARAIIDLQNRGAIKFILDLRDNSGGLLDAGIEIARMFLKSGVVIEEQYRGKDIESFEVQTIGQFADIPLVILVNHTTASAAEIIAGSIQAHHRALLAGTTTFGKDKIQLIFDLEDGSSLHITAANWWIPGLAFPSEQGGLIPDIIIPDEDIDTDLAVEYAAQALLTP